MTLTTNEPRYNFAAAAPPARVCLRCNGRFDQATGLLRHAPSCPELANGRIANTSGLEPFGVAVLVLPYEPEINSTLIVIPENVRERTAMVETRALVIALGNDLLGDSPLEKPRAQPGQRVMLVRFAGVMAVGPADRRQYRLVNNRDIYCGITKEEEKTDG